MAMVAKVLYLLVLAVPFALVASVVAAGEKYSGKWDGITNTSIEILSISPLSVRYCYRSDCSNNRPGGSLGKMNFAWPRSGSFPGAKMTLTKQGAGYHGVYQQNGSTRFSEADFLKN